MTKPETQNPETWSSRIVGHAEVDPKTIAPNPLNWRAHPKHQSDAVEGLIGALGWVRSVLVNQRTGNMLDGHLRLSLALERKESVVPVEYVDVSEDEERLILATLDPVAALAQTNAARFLALREVLDIQAESIKNLVAAVIPQFVDVQAEWRGMPEFIQPGAGPVRTILVHFQTNEDVEKFAQAIFQTITPLTKYVWFPYRGRDSESDHIYVAEDNGNADDDEAL